MSSIILSPEYVGKNRREARTAQDTPTGALVSLDANGQFVFTTAAGKRQYVATENVSTAQAVDYTYATGETCFAASLPAGARVQLVAGSATTYTVGDEVEIGANGAIVALAAGEAVGVVVETKAAAVGDLVKVDLI